MESSNALALWDKLPALSWRNKAAYLTYEFLKLPQIEAPVSHIFEDGVYIREVRLPAGSVFTGREHLLGHEVQLLEGSAVMVAPDGKHKFDAYASIHTKPGYHCVATALTNIVARTIHPNPTNEKDITALETKWFGTAEAMIERGRLLAKMLELELEAA